MNSFILPIGKAAGAALPTVIAALSCGAAPAIADPDILHIVDSQNDTLLPNLIGDINTIHDFLAPGGHSFLFPASFRFDSFRPQLPSLDSLTSDPSSSALVSALRGKGMPLSYRTDREAVEWAFAFMLSGKSSGQLSPYLDWTLRIRNALNSGEDTRICVLCDLCDPFSAGAAFALLRHLHQFVGNRNAFISILSLAMHSAPPSEAEQKALNDALTALEQQHFISPPGTTSHEAPADACWLLSLPSSMIRSEDSWRIVWLSLARVLGRVCSSEKKPDSGLHTLTLPGVMTLQSMGDQAESYAAFLHCSVWLLCDLLPSLHTYYERTAPLRSLAPNTRNGVFKRLFRQEKDSAEIKETLPVLERVIKALLSETLSLIRSLPDSLRLPEISDPLWQQAVDACGRTVTVASEYDVLKAETESAGIMDIKPVHRVSLTDTEEEKQLRRLEEINSQLQEETGSRFRLFTTLGAGRSWLALRDCRDKCRNALKSAEEKAALLSLDPAVSPLTLAAQERRISLLKAAVARCESDLSDREMLKKLSEPSSGASSGLSPFASRLLSQAAAEKLSAFLIADGENADLLMKECRTLMPSLFCEGELADTKALFKELIPSSSDGAGCNSLAYLVSCAASVSRKNVSGLRFLSAGSAPGIPMLPDLYPDHQPLTVRELLPLLPSFPDAASFSETAKRGLLACLLLRQYRRRSSDDAALAFRSFRSDDSPVLKAWLNAHNADKVWIVSLQKEEDSLPFALILPGQDLIPARWTASHALLFPDFCSSWFDADLSVFLDPCPLLCEGDRMILQEQLASILDKLEPEAHSSLHAFLSAFKQDLVSETPVTLPDRMELRLKAAFGLRMLPAFAPSLTRVPAFYEHFLSDDRVASCLSGQESFPASACNVPDDIVYCYRNVPFARENSVTLLQGIPLPSEDYILNLLSQESRTLSRSSDDYHDALVRELSLLLERYPDAAGEARDVVLGLMDKASRPVTDSVTDLVWPWDPFSPSVMTILSESLGDRLAFSAVKPFSDVLALFPARGGDVLGDSLLGSMCILRPDVQGAEQQENQSAPPSDAVLPPLSPGFASSLCRLPEGRTLLSEGFLRFHRSDENSIKVTMLLEGRFPVRLIRTYSEEEILNLYSHDIPTLAVWPDLPFAQEDWKAYYIYASLPSSLELSMITEKDESDVSGDSSRAVTCSPSFPLCFFLKAAGRSVGAVPNLLPCPETAKEDVVTACIDFGSAGTSVVLSSGQRRKPLQGPTLVRTLLNNPAASRGLLRREFLPAVPVSALLPTVSRIFRNVPGAPPMPFEDGIVLMTADLQDVLSIPSDALYTSLKWEEEKGRSVKLCLHQIMLMTALQARSDGASTLLWRFAVPDDMAKAGREKLRDLFITLAAEVNETAGFPVPVDRPVVTFAAESSALGAYFRFCASEDTRGGFMVLDIGACTADISLFLRGKEQAIRTCQIPLGIWYMLLPSLLRNPSLLRQDLGFIQDPAFLRDLSLLEQILARAGADTAALRHSRLALDSFIADRASFLLPALMYNPATGMPTRLGSYLLLYFSYLMMLSGLVLLQISTDPGKNDFLPEQMSLCLAGRGSALLEGLPDQIKTGLWHCLTMFRNQRVSSLSLLFSSEKKMEIPVGLSLLQEVTPDLPAASAIPAAVSVRPEELLPQFLLRFAKEFPASAALLFPGFFTNDFYHPFTPRGESAISAAIAQSFTEQTALRPFDSLSAWIGSLLDLI